MTRFLTTLLLLTFWTSPAFAHWFGSTDGICTEGTPVPTEPAWSTDADMSEEGQVRGEDGCTEATLTDPSSNACFEGAEYPISILPHVIAETQAERVTAKMVRKLEAMIRPPIVLPSPDEASVEDPAIPGVPLVKLRAPKEQPAPNSCTSLNPSDCETVPWVPTIEIEVSRVVAFDTTSQFILAPLPELEGRRGPPSTGLDWAAGVRSRVERPPELA